jgi:LysM repeat protein
MSLLTGIYQAAVHGPRAAAMIMDSVRNQPKTPKPGTNETGGAAAKAPTSASGSAGRVEVGGTSQPAAGNFNSAPSDSVTLSKGAQQTGSSSSVGQQSSSVVVDKWGTGKNDCLESILKNQGYSTEEIYQKGADGKSLLDKVAAINKLRNPNLIHAGQELTIPSKETPREAGSQGLDTEANGIGFAVDDNSSNQAGIDKLKSGLTTDRSQVRELDRLIREMANGKILSDTTTPTWNREKNGSGFVVNDNSSNQQGLAKFKDGLAEDNNGSAAIDSFLNPFLTAPIGEDIGLA